MPSIRSTALSTVQSLLIFITNRLNSLLNEERFKNYTQRHVHNHDDYDLMECLAFVASYSFFKLKDEYYGTRQ